MTPIFWTGSEIFLKISSGTVIPSALQQNVESTYGVELEEIKNLGLNINDEKIIEALQKFNGHINLSLRYLLTVNSIISN